MFKCMHKHIYSCTQSDDEPKVIWDAGADFKSDSQRMKEATGGMQVCCSVCCRVLQRVAVLKCVTPLGACNCVAVCIAACCSVLPCAAV